MTKQKAGERKRTVTITLGPLTWAYLEMLQEEYRESPGGVRINMTSVAAGAMATGLTYVAKAFGKPLPEGLLTTYD